MWTAIFTLGFLLSFATEGSAFNAIMCGEPKGVRYDYEPSGEIKLDNDGFSGVQLLFRVDPQESQRLFVYWGDTATFAQSPFSELYKSGKEPTTATIIARTASTLTAVERESSGAMWMYSFFQDRGIGFYSKHKPATVVHPPVAASLMFSACRFDTH